MFVIPVMLPPGWARLVTKPAARGSPVGAITIGIVVVAFFAASTAGVRLATMTFTFILANSVAIWCARSTLPSALRHSMAMFLPSA